MLYKKLTTTTLLAGSMLAFGDVQYEQTSKVTAGAIANMPIVGSRMKEPMVTTNLLKGNRMATLEKDSITIYDLDKESITMVNPGKREYSVMTFAEMREAMDKAMAKMQEAMQQKNTAEMKWTVKVDATGETKEVNGFDATKYIVTLDGVTKDAKSGKTIGSRMTMDSWMAKSVPGLGELNAFSKRMAEKLGAGRMGGVNPMVQAQMGKGWYEAAAQFAKMEGFNVLTVTRMSTTVDGQVMMVPEGQQNGPQVNGGEVARDAATSAATNAALGKLGGRMGGLGSGIGSGIGGFGRKKKKEEPAPAPQEQSASSNGTGMVPAIAMEFQLDVTTMSTGSVDASKFEVPAGYKQVESELKKMAR